MEGSQTEEERGGEREKMARQPSKREVDSRGLTRSRANPPSLSNTYALILMFASSSFSCSSCQSSVKPASEHGWLSRVSNVVRWTSAGL